MTTRVLNAHHFKGVEHLPPNAKYVGRPSEFGNSWSSKSGLYSVEECVAFNRIDIYIKLTSDKSYLSHLRSTLGGYDLACWCKSEHHVKGCHADNYKHILSEQCASRAYDKGVLVYLMQDLKWVLGKVPTHTHHNWDKTYLNLDIIGDEIRSEIHFLLHLIKVQKPKYASEEELEVRYHAICKIIARIVIELELAVQETKVEYISYRYMHVLWTIHQYMYKRDTRLDEPLPPTVRKPKGKSNDRKLNTSQDAGQT